MTARVAIGDLARELGLGLPVAWKATGELCGVEASVATGGDDRAVVVVRVKVPVPGESVVLDRRGRSGGWRLGLGLDEHLMVGSDDPGALGTLLADPEVYSRLAEVVGAAAAFELRGRKLLVQVDRCRTLDQVADDVLRVADLARRLQRQMLWTWDSLAHELLLDFDWQAVTMSGEHRRVQVYAQYFADPPARTVLTAWLERPLPPETHIGHPDVHLAAGTVGDPVLDPMLAFHSSDLPVVAERVRADAVRGPLLSLIREYPGSVVLEREIHLVVPGLLTRDLRERLELIVELAAALR